MVHDGLTTGGLQKTMLLVFMKEKANEGGVWTLWCSPPLHTVRRLLQGNQVGRAGMHTLARPATELQSGL